MTRYLASIVALLVASCDPQDSTTVQGTATRTDSPAESQNHAPPVVGPGVPRAATAGGDFTGCLLACDAAKLNHADKATCRFECEGPDDPIFGSGPDTTAAVGTDPIGYFVTCMDRCTIDGKQSDRCKSACKSAVISSPAAPTTAVFEELVMCLDTCRVARGVSETNHATCSLDCAQVARVAGPAPADVATKAVR